MSEAKATTDLVLAAIRHLERDLRDGRDVSYLGEIADPGQLRCANLGELGDKLNFGDVALSESPGKGVETYRTVALSTAHLTAQDLVALQSKSGGSTMVMERDTGFFVKLYCCEETEITNTDERYSDHLNAILAWAVEQGFQLVEFDCDAPAVDLFPCFEHDMEVA